MNYTKGEWKLDDTGTAIFSNDRLIANCGGWQVTQNEPESLKENKSNAHLIAQAPAMYEALKRIMILDTNSSLDAMAYSGGDIPKKWLREVAPSIDARAKARKEIQAIIKPVLSKLEEVK